MSHYSVTVILDKDKVSKYMTEGYSEQKSVSKVAADMLEKYDEEIEVAPYISKTREDLQKEYETVLAGANGAETSFSSEWCRLKKEKGQLDSYQSYINLMYDEEDIDEDGDVISTYNPNSKYDYYTFMDFQAETGEKVLYCKLKDKKRRRDVDIEAIRKDYEDLFTDNKSDYGRFGMDALMSLPALFEKYPDFETYLEQRTAIYSYAILTEKDEWIEPGQMGWFGCSSATPEAEGSFHRVYKEVIENADPEHYVVVIDCHI